MNSEDIFKRYAVVEKNLARNDIRILGTYRSIANAKMAITELVIESYEPVIDPQTNDVRYYPRHNLLIIEETLACDE